MHRNNLDNNMNGTFQKYKFWPKIQFALEIKVFLLKIEIWVKNGTQTIV